MKKIYISGVFLLGLLLFFIIRGLFGNYCLVLRGEEGQIYLRERVHIGDEFSVKFIHSVNKSPVIDFYTIKKDGIYVTKTLYYDFGAGVQTELEEGQSLSYTKDGGMLVEGFDRKIEALAYVVGKVSDHELELQGEIYSLEKLCGKGAYVEFDIERVY